MINAGTGIGATAKFTLGPADQIESQAARRTSEIRYRRLFEAARDGIPIVHPETVEPLSPGFPASRLAKDSGN
jgi:hypothetical protein